MSDNRLPSTFEEFSEARKNGFLKAKAIKDNGGRIAGTFCTFTPNEIFDAAGIHTVSLCGTSEETISAAEVDLPKNLCPLIKSSYGFAVSDKCPYTYFSDIIVGETTCDGKKKMYELLGEIKDVHVMQLPQGIDRPYAKDMWTAELRYLIETLEKKFGVTITDEELREACEIRNEQRQAKVELMELQKLVPPPAYSKNLYKVLDSGNFSFDQKASTEAVKQMTQKIKDAYDAGQRPVSADAKRILVTGCPIGGVLDKTVGIIEENGGVVVCMENCGGIKPARHMVDTSKEDIVEAIAERYLQIGCAVMTPNNQRMNLLRQLVEEFKVEGIVDIILQTCHPYSVERYQVRKLSEELGIPYLSVETDYSHSDQGQLTTRLSAFIEMLDEA
ncbi:MAG: 2-hydroxyacyl-CoA dehydratase [Lachnospiraceae bacterium]|nr:2-hydroxyacyl-CoA dehydratase [Candidatus Equihabitans merdae]